MCGLSVMRASPWKGWGPAIGSTAKLSRPALPTCPDRTASSSAASSISPPRAVFTMITPRLQAASARASTSLALSAVSGQCSEIASDSRQIVSRSVRWMAAGRSWA